jgi:DNA-binding IclR family transcriptional regulator
MSQEVTVLNAISFGRASISLPVHDQNQKPNLTIFISNLQERFKIKK